MLQAIHQRGHVADTAKKPRDKDLVFVLLGFHTTVLRIRDSERDCWRETKLKETSTYTNRFMFCQINHCHVMATHAGSYITFFFFLVFFWVIFLHNKTRTFYAEEKRYQTLLTSPATFASLDWILFSIYSRPWFFNGVLHCITSPSLPSFQRFVSLNGKISLLWQKWTEERSMDGGGRSETGRLHSETWAWEVANPTQKCR